MEPNQIRPIGGLDVDGNATSEDQINKWLTVWRCTNGYLSLEGCQAAFLAHPEWGSL